MSLKIFLFGWLILSCAAVGSAQTENAALFDESKLPSVADTVEKFVPSGWTIEARATGDLNNDSIADTALKLIEKPAAKIDADNPPSRSRILLVLLKNADGKFTRAATAKTLLQCTGCGGAFYGVVEAPADIEISKGILSLRQDHGSREVTETTFKFRYDSSAKKFALIGYDQTNRDRATGETTVESSNYLTGVKIIQTLQYSQKLDKDVKKGVRQAKIARTPQYIEKIDYEKFGGN